jgi:hypothetical protein
MNKFLRLVNALIVVLIFLNLRTIMQKLVEMSLMIEENKKRIISSETRAFLARHR